MYKKDLVEVLFVYILALNFHKIIGFAPHKVIPIFVRLKTYLILLIKNLFKYLNTH